MVRAATKELTDIKVTPEDLLHYTGSLQPAKACQGLPAEQSPFRVYSVYNMPGTRTLGGCSLELESIKEDKGGHNYKQKSCYRTNTIPDSENVIPMDR